MQVKKVYTTLILHPERHRKRQHPKSLRDEFHFRRFQKCDLYRGKFTTMCIWHFTITSSVILTTETSSGALTKMSTVLIKGNINQIVERRLMLQRITYIWKIRAPSPDHKSLLTHHWPTLVFFCMADIFYTITSAKGVEYTVLIRNRSEGKNIY